VEDKQVLRARLIAAHERERRAFDQTRAAYAKVKAYLQDKRHPSADSLREFSEAMNEYEAALREGKRIEKQLADLEGDPPRATHPGRRRPRRSARSRP
jgi:hypothetical protein